MSARTLSQLAVVVLAFAALALGAILVLREGGSLSATPDAGPCDLTSAPPALSPASEDSVLLVFADPGVKVALDGRPVTSVVDDPQSFPVGEHVLSAACGAQAAREQTIELVAFTPAAVHASCETLTTFGAGCDGCPPLAAARKAAAKAGRQSGVFAAAATQEKLELAARTRAAGVLVNRWNALTERYSRVLQVVGREAPGAVASANQRFEELSGGFKKATNDKDPLGQDASIRAAEETLRVFVRAARLARPGDCEYQKRLTDSF